MIIIGGASRGLGMAVAQRLKDRGEEVLGFSRSIDKADFEIRQADISNIDDLRKLSEDIRKSGKKVSGLINLAGIASMNLALFANHKTSARLVEVNFLGTVYFSQTFAPLLIRNGGGSIINFSSIATAINLEGESIYGATKAAVENYSKTLAMELSTFNVRVNCVAPGPIRTNLLNGVTENQISEVLKNQIIRKEFTHANVCDLVELLLDPRAEGITGQVIHLGGVR
jgi:3-oxoacyl-[acyl-carrier protein] reductase